MHLPVLFLLILSAVFNKRTCAKENVRKMFPHMATTPHPGPRITEPYWVGSRAPLYYNDNNEDKRHDPIADIWSRPATTWVGLHLPYAISIVRRWWWGRILRVPATTWRGVIDPHLIHECGKLNWLMSMFVPRLSGGANCSDNGGIINHH